jgi:hypothetical protein
MTKQQLHCAQVSIQMVQAMAYSFFVDKLSNPQIFVRLGADSRHVAG